MAAGRRRLLVTGAAGFIGTNLLMRIKDNPDYDVVGVWVKREPVVCAANIRYVQADLRQPGECRRVVDGREMVCMLAGRLSTAAVLAQHPLGPVAENTVTTTQMLDAAHAAGVKTFLWLSSATGYPPGEHPMREDEFFIGEPSPPYQAVGFMSRYLETLARLYATVPKRPMNVAVLRPSAVFGPHDDFEFETCHALPALMRRVVERHHPVEMWGTGSDERDWLYVDDLVDACMLALERISGYEVFNVGSGTTYSLNELLTILLKLDGYEHTTVVRRLDRPTRVSRRRLDCARAERCLGFRAKTPIEEGLALTVRWYRDHRLQQTPVVGGSLSHA